MDHPRLHEHPAYPSVKRLQRNEGRSLMARHGAHALGIGWSHPEGEPAEPALVFYIDEEAPAGDPVPPTLEATDDAGRPIRIPTRVVSSPPASSE